MSIMAKTPSGYKKIGSAYLGERPVDKVFNANGDVVYALQRELTGVPPLLFKGKEQSELLNYRIYGDTVDGESVGDRTGNLFDKNGVWVNGYINDNGEFAENNGIATYTEFINVKPDTDYSLICDSSVSEGVRFNFYDSSKNFISRIFRNMGNPTVTTPSTCEYITLSINKNQIRYLMITEGSTAPTEYEPYGYKVPIAVTNSGTTSNETIYLPEPIKMVGDEAEYIDYGEQKMHRVRKNLLPRITATYSGDGILLKNESDGTVSVSGVATKTVFLRLKYNVSYPFDTILSGCAQGGISGVYLLRALTTTTPRNIYSDFGNGVLIPANTNIYIEIRIQEGTECNNLEFKPMIRKVGIEDDTYEPYIENTDLDVTLPALLTLTGTNEMSVGTEVQPSRMDIKGRIKSLT